MDFTISQPENEKICFKCKDIKKESCFSKNKRTPDGLQAGCKECAAKYRDRPGAKARHKINYARYHNTEKGRAAARRGMAKYHKTENGRKYRNYFVAKYREANQHKIKAQKAVYGAIKKGSLKRLPCEVCGKEKSEAHHHDYGKPLDVKWLCRAHHLAEHGKYMLESELIPGHTVK